MIKKIKFKLIIQSFLAPVHSQVHVNEEARNHASSKLYLNL